MESERSSAVSGIMNPPKRRASLCASPRSRFQQALPSRRAFPFVVQSCHLTELRVKFLMRYQPCPVVKKSSYVQIPIAAIVVQREVRQGVRAWLRSFFFVFLFFLGFYT